MSTAENKFVVKKNNSYICIANDNFKFLDITQYLAPGSSYSSFLTAFGVEEQKSFFPYQWFDDASKLNFNQLPPYDAFYSDLKKENVLETELRKWSGKGEKPKSGPENYANLQHIWKQNKMSTFKDFLIYYNNLDVRPMVEGVCKLQEFYKNNHIDLFKISISVPGIARKMLFDSAKCHFSLCGSTDQDLYYTIKQNIVGGPSIIFNRHHKSGETKIREGDKICQNIVGYDANALYLWALGQPMPTGCFVRRLAEDRFKPKLSTDYMSMYFWMDHVAKQENIKILHKLNNGSEVRFGKYLADGYCPQTNTIYTFNDCYFHGHDCHLTKHITDEDKRKALEKAREKTQQREEELKNM
jgi:hypothetical protein